LTDDNFMGAIAIEINDAGLVVADESGVRAVEPGFAHVDRGRIVTGEDARRLARLKPRQTSNRFWSALSLEPNSAGADIGKSAAELAYAQLGSLWQRIGAGTEDVVLVVPGSYGKEQLGLLLGLAHECDIPVRALVDAAAAASVRPYPNRQLMHVDAGLHRVAATVMEQAHDAAVQAEHALGQAGLSAVFDTMARRIADAFVRATRFDPFQHAEAEQQLYDRLPEWLAALHAEQQLELLLAHRGEEFRVTADRDALLQAVAGFYRAITQLIAQHRDAGNGLVVQLSDRLAALPGLVSELSRLDDAHIERLAPGHAARGALAARGAARSADGQVRLVKRLQWREPALDVPSRAPRETTTASRPRNAPPTHVVYRGVAYAVGRGLVIGREPDANRRTLSVEEGGNGVSRAHCELALRDGELWLRDLSRHGTFVNERKVAGETTLNRADVIRVGSPGAELEVVSLEEFE
jgi:hypothetical protein